MSNPVYNSLGRLETQRDEALARVAQLEAAIRQHQDARGDDRCWQDDEALYAILPEGYTPPARDTAVELSNCQRYIANRQNPATEYTSPEREIERLKNHISVAKDVVTDSQTTLKALEMLLENLL